MDDLNRKKPRQPGGDEQAGTAGQDAAALPDTIAAPRPPARKRRTSDAVERALSILATGKAPAMPDASPVDPGAARPKPKLVRTSFSLAKDDHLTLGALKDACRARGVGAKKSQLLRVAVGLLRELEPARLAELVAALPPARKAK